MDLIDDLDIRIHHRALMDSAGFRRIIVLCRELAAAPTNKHLDDLGAKIDEDEQRLKERQDAAILGSFSNPEDIWNALCLRRIRPPKITSSPCCDIYC